MSMSCISSPPRHLHCVAGQIYVTFTIRRHVTLLSGDNVARASQAQYHTTFHQNPSSIFQVELCGQTNIVSSIFVHLVNLVQIT
jgi:hypothetical protein